MMTTPATSMIVRTMLATSDSLIPMKLTADMTMMRPMANSGPGTPVIAWR